jgi:hypothetical protein
MLQELFPRCRVMKEITGLREILAMITEKRVIARNSQANANDCNEESRVGI